MKVGIILRKLWSNRGKGDEAGGTVDKVSVLHY
jgi:hypothetical protein